MATSRRPTNWAPIVLACFRETLRSNGSPISARNFRVSFFRRPQTLVPRSRGRGGSPVRRCGRRIGSGRRNSAVPGNTSARLMSSSSAHPCQQARKSGTGGCHAIATGASRSRAVLTFGDLGRFCLFSMPNIKLHKLRLAQSREMMPGLWERLMRIPTLRK